jgi:MOSC domain-containing protein YiiM
VTSARVLQVNVSKGGVPKRAVGSARVTLDGLEGDSWTHANIHGGPRQAVLLVTVESIQELSALGFPLFAGALGENVTSTGLDRRAVRLGQRYRMGDAVIEIRKIRAPCATLHVYGKGIEAAIYDAQTQRGDPASPRWGLSGFYASVVEEGTVRTGDAIALITRE